MEKLKNLSPVERLKLIAGINVLLLVIIILVKDPFGMFVKTFEGSDPFFSKLPTEAEHSQVKVIDIQPMTKGKMNKEKAVILREAGAGKWMVKGRGQKGKYLADKKKVDKIFELLKDARRFIPVSSREEQQVATKTDENGDGVKVTLKNADKEDIHSFFIGKPIPGGAKTFVRMSDESEIFSLNGNYNQVLNQNLQKWRDKSMFLFPAADVISYKAQIPDQPTVSLTKDGNEWKIGPPTNNTGDTKKVESLVKKMANLKAKKIIMDPEKAQKNLAKAPVGKVEAVIKTGKGKTRTEILYIQQVRFNEVKEGGPKKPTVKDYMVTNTARKEIFVVSAGNIKNLTREGDKLKQKAKPKTPAAGTANPLPGPGGPGGAQGISIPE